jgi:S-formylglutathione hydrolase
MSAPTLQRFEVADPIHGRVPCAALLPARDAAPRAVCLFLYGGGGSRESLAEIEPLLRAWSQSERLAPMIIATPDVGPWSFYLDDPQRGLGWESFVAKRMTAYLQREFCGGVTLPLGAVGISMGGYAALKLALVRPRTFAAVAAISPMIEPAFEAAEVRPRNRYHYPAEVPQALLGAQRDPALYRADHPAGRAQRNANALRASELAVYIDAAGADALHAHDGAEHLHRVLWDLDVPHEYHLRRDSDHVGPDLIARLEQAFTWVSERVAPAPSPQLNESERAWLLWLDGDRSSSPPPAMLPPTSPLFSRVLRAQLDPLRRAAEASDPSFERRYGLLPSTHPRA